MTNNDINDIIDLLLSANITKIKFSMEVNAEKNLRCKPCACSNRSVMNELRTDLKELTFFFIQLFYKTERKYSCTQTKLGKLLSILAFKYAINGEKLFDEQIYRYSPRCGTQIKALIFVPKDVYVRGIDQVDPDKSITIEEIHEDADIPSQYLESSSLAPKIREEAKNVFLNFGAYRANTLGNLLNPIVDHLVTEDNDTVDLSYFSKLEMGHIDDGKNNSIVTYIYQQ